MAQRLIPEAEELLSTLVEASKNVARDRRGSFIATRAMGGHERVQHPGFPAGSVPIHWDDLDMLLTYGLIIATNRQRGATIFYVAPEGYEYYAALKAEEGAADARREDWVRRYFDTAGVIERYPQASAKLRQAEELLWSSDAEAQFTTIGHLCREAMQHFASELLGRFPVPDVDPDAAHTVARVRAVLPSVRDGVGETAAAFLDALLAYWGTVADLSQRQEHASQKEGTPLVWDDGRRLVFHTFMVIVEVDATLARSTGLPQ